MTDDTLLEDLMRAADPYPESEQTALARRHIAVRDAIMAADAGQKHVAPRRWRRARGTVAPAAAVAAIGAVLAVAAGAFALQTAPVSGPVEPPALSDEWTDEFRDARARATSDFERLVLADDWIAPAEYDEAVQMYVQCAADAGITITVRGNIADETRMYDVTSSLGQTKLNAILSECGDGTINVLEGLYDTILHSGERAELMAACLVAVGAVPSPYSASDYARDAEDQQFTRWMVNDDQASKCWDNPQYAR